MPGDARKPRRQLKAGKLLEERPQYRLAHFLNKNGERPMNDALANAYLESVLFRFRNAKELGDKAMAQLDDADLTWRPGPESNSIAVIVQHLRGNMISRWTDFLTSDGEKPTRNRDAEFDEPPRTSRNELLDAWNAGWDCLLNAIAAMRPEDLLKEVTIRGQALTALDAINRQLSHVPYHVGQIVYLARMRKGKAWQTLSIARGASKDYTPRKRD